MLEVMAHKDLFQAPPPQRHANYLADVHNLTTTQPSVSGSVISTASQHLEENINSKHISPAYIVSQHNIYNKVLYCIGLILLENRFFLLKSHIRFLGKLVSYKPENFVNYRISSPD